jgi:putative transposase
MSTPSNLYRGFRYPDEIINQAVWLYHCFSLSLREVELILAARGIVVSYETICEWSLRLGRAYARTLKRRRPQPGYKWFLDEAFVRIRGKLHYLWRAIDQHGNVLDVLVQRRRNTKPHAQQFLAIYNPIHNHFQLRRHRLSASEYRVARDRAVGAWRDATGAALVV